jgi:cysteine synthase
MTILDAIGNASLVPLRRITPPGTARVFVKLEWENAAQNASPTPR